MRREIRYAFIKTIPVLLGYLFLGLAFGLLLQKSGYSFWWALLSSTVIYAGSIQFVLVSFLSGGTSLLTAAVMTLLINSRHAFYGLSFVEKFRSMKTYPYMVFSLTDETYSLLCSTKVPEGMEEKRVLFLISFFDQCYWVTGSVLGAALGEILPFDMTGIDFAMTALFLVMFTDQWEKTRNHKPALTGLGCSAACLAVFGSGNFILPSMACIILCLLVDRKTNDKEAEEQ